MLKIPKVYRQNDTPAEFGQHLGGHRNTLNQQHKHVRFRVFGEHDQELCRGRKHWIYDEDLGETCFQGAVDKHAIQHVVEQLDKEKARKKRFSWRRRYSTSSLSKYTFLNSSSGDSSSGTSSPGNVNTSNIDHTRAAVEIDKIQRLFQIDLQDQRHAIRAGRPAFAPLSSSPERERIQRLFEDDLHQKRLELKRERYIVLQNHSNSLQIVKEWGMKRIAEGLKSRIKRLNDRITALLRRKSKGIKA